MPMTQEDIRAHYETEWRHLADHDDAKEAPRHCDILQDSLIGPIYRSVVRDLRIKADGGRILDVGCGSGRWIRYLLEWFNPTRLVGLDSATSSIDLLDRWHGDAGDCDVEFINADLTQPTTLDERFDLINAGNVLFHIPENTGYEQALRNLAGWLEPEGHLITTEYLPRTNMRTEFMLVRSRYDFESMARTAGLRIVDIRPTGFFTDEPFGIDGPDPGVRGLFHKVRSGIKEIMSADVEGEGKAFAIELLTTIELSLIQWCRERVPAAELPAQKLVTLARQQ